MVVPLDTSIGRVIVYSTSRHPDAQLLTRVAHFKGLPAVALLPKSG